MKLSAIFIQSLTGTPFGLLMWTFMGVFTELSSLVAFAFLTIYRYVSVSINQSKSEFI